MTEAPPERPSGPATEPPDEDTSTSATVEAAAGRAESARDDAQEARADAEQARDDAQQAQAGAFEAGTAALEAASLVVPADDPVLDTAARRLEARVDEENPFGRPGRPLASRSPFRLAFTAALGVALAYSLVRALIAVQSVLVLLLAAAFLAIGLSPAVDFFVRHGVKRGRAVGIVLVAVLLFFVGVGFAVVPPIATQSQAFVDAAPGYLQQLQDNTRIAEFDQRFGLLTRLEALLNDPQKLGVTAAGGVLGVGKFVFGFLFSALTLLILTLYFLSSLPAIKANAYRLVPRSRRARVGLLADEILSRVGGYVAGAFTIALIAAGTTYVLLLVLGVDYPLALATVVFVTDLIPLVGATIGAAIVTAVALFTSVRTGLIVGGFYLVYQQLENYLLYPRIMKRSVDVSPAATVVAVLIGGSLLGVLGALLAIPIAAAVQLVLQEVIAPRQDQL